MMLAAIEIVAVAEADEQALRSRLPVQAGSLVARAELGAAAKVVRELNAYLTFKFLEIIVDGRPEVRIRISGLGTAPSTVYIQEPEVIQRVEPEYSESLKERGVKGAVELAATIGADGTVREVAVVSGDPELAELASKAVLQWRYRPAFADAQPVEVRRAIQLNIPVPMGVTRLGRAQ